MQTARMKTKPWLSGATSNASYPVRITARRLFAGAGFFFGVLFSFSAPVSFIKSVGNSDGTFLSRNSNLIELSVLGATGCFVSVLDTCILGLVFKPGSVPPVRIGGTTEGLTSKTGAVFDLAGFFFSVAGVVCFGDAGGF